MENTTLTLHPVEEKLVRHYAEKREADIVLKVRYSREPAGEGTLLKLESSEELSE